MAIAIVNRKTPTSGGGATTTPSVTITAGTSGNVMYVWVGLNTATDSTPSAVELGVGGSGKTFTQVAAINNAANCRLYLYRRVLQAGDTETTITATQSSARQSMLAVYELSGVDTTTPEDLVGAGATGTSIANENTGTTGGTTASGALVLGCVTSRNGHTAIEDTANETPSTGWTFNTGTTGAAGGAQLALSTFDQSLSAAANSQGSASNTPSSDPFAGLIISVKPAGAGSPPSNSTPGVLTPTGDQPVGMTLTATAGSWTNTPTSYTYTWKRGTTTVQTTTTATTSDTYVPQNADIGATITCKVSASNSSGASGQTTDTGSASIIPAATGSVSTAPGGYAVGPVAPAMHHLTITLDRPGAMPLRLTRQADSVSWTTVVPGGFGSATLTFPGDRRRDLPHLATLRIMFDQRVLFEGRIEKPVVDLTSDGWSTTIQAFGNQRLLDDTSIRRLWVMGVRELQGTTLPAGSDQFGKALVDGSFYATPQVGNFDPTDPSKFGVAVFNSNTASNSVAIFVPSGAAGAWAGARILAPDGLAFTALSGLLDGVNGGGGSYCQAIVQSSADGSSFSVVMATCATFFAGAAQNRFDGAQGNGATFILTLPASTREIRIGYEVAKASDGINQSLQLGGYPPAPPSFHNLRVYGTGLNLPSLAGYYGGAILADLIAQVSGLTVGTIEDGSDFAIPEIERTARDTARSVVNEVAGYYRREWAVWEDGRFDWKLPNLDEPQWVTLTNELTAMKIQTDTDPLAATTYVAYTDPTDQRTHETSASSTSADNPYVKTGKTKDIVVSAQAPLTSTTAAALASKLNTDAGTRPISSATIRIAGTKLIRRATGNPTPAYAIRAGENITIADAPTTKPLGQGRDGQTLFHVISTSADSASGMVTLECDGYQSAGDVLLARLTAATRAVTG